MDENVRQKWVSSVLLAYALDADGLIFRVKDGKRSPCHLGYKGYVSVTACGKTVGYHRLVWLLHNRRMPVNQIDHINGDRSDNAIGNLREASSAENCRNRRSSKQRAKGIYLFRGRFFKASIQHQGKRKFLGVFRTPDEAAHAYNKAAVRLNGEFACLNPVGVAP